MRCVGIIVALCWGLLPSTWFARAAETPNVVIFLADDLGYGDLACYGNTVIKSPHLDRFATQGMRLTDCHSACPVCSPSRSAILTGRTPYRNGVFTWLPANQEIHLRQSEVTLAKLLKQRGYATCHVGKWHLNGHFNSDKQPQPGDHGYDHWFATQNNAGPSHKNPNNFVRNGKDVGPLTGYSADLVVGEAIDWLKSRDGKKPFFLTVWTHEPHLPIESDPVHMAHYSALADEDVRQHHGNVTQLDAAFGKLMRTLDDLKLTDTTFVAFTSDNGPEGNGNNNRTRGSTGGFRGRKRSVYEGGIRVAGMLRWPGRITPGSTSDVPAIGSDLFPTVCEITGTAQPSDRVIDGATLVPLFTGKPVSRPKPLYWRYGGAPEPVKLAMRIDQWKILASEDLSLLELYDLKTDPHEKTDLAKSPEHAATFAKMKSALTDLNREIEAEGPAWWKGYFKTNAAKKAKKAVNSKKCDDDNDGEADLPRACGDTGDADREAILSRMRALHRERKWKELIEQFAAEDFTKWPADPSHQASEALHLRGQIYSFLKEGLKADADLKAALKLAPKNAACWLTLADNYTFNLKADDSALDAYRHAFAITGKGNGWQPLTATTAIARLLTDAGKPDEAIAVLQQYGDMEGMAPVWRIKLLRAYGHAYAARGNEKESLAKFREALELESPTRGAGS